jgi:Fe-S-cluster containining protein
MNRTLDEIYASLPAMVCRGKCQECCGPIGMSPEEVRRIEDAVDTDGIEGITDPESEVTMLMELVCPLLDWKGACSVYEHRPFICRLWGLTEDMKCPYGCVPEGGWLDSRTSVMLLGEAMNAGGARFDLVKMAENFDERAHQEFMKRGASNERRRIDARRDQADKRRGIGRI